MQAAALEAEDSDPLGLGKIDNRQIQLVNSACPQLQLPLGKYSSIFSGINIPKPGFKHLIM